MKKIIITTIVATFSLPVLAISETNVNISIGAPTIAVPAPPNIVFQAPPLFLAPPKLGFYIGVDMPYDLVFISGSYYLFQGNNWYRSRHYNGPWNFIGPDHLPPAIRNYNIEKIRHHREHEYRSYREERDHYRGRHYRPYRDQRENRKEHQRYDKEERRRDREERKEEHHDQGRHRGHND